jgi:hypothetical protein
MGSGHINAAQLLSSFLGSETEKIGQAAAQCDFAGELKKLMEPGSTTAASSNGSVTSGTGGETHSIKTSRDKSSASSGTSSLTLPQQGRGRKVASGAGSKISQAKSKAQTERSLFVTNPAIVQTVLADLKYPAETRKTIKETENSQGQISIKDLRSALDTQPATVSGSVSLIPAEHARALVESIAATETGATMGDSSSSGNFNAAVQLKTEGSYTPEEFRGLLDKVVQQAEDTQAKAQLSDLKQQSGAAETGQDGSSAGTVEIPRTGQTESLAATVLPSFIFADGGNASTTKVFSSGANNAGSETQNVKFRQMLEKPAAAVSDKLNSEVRTKSEGKVLQAAERLQTAASTDAETKTADSGTTPVPASSAPVRQEAKTAPVTDLNPILNQFQAKLTAADAPHQIVSNAAGTPGPEITSTDLTPQAQNLASQVKGVERQADRSQIASNSAGISRESEEPSGADRMKTAPAEPSTKEQSFSESASQQSSNPAPETQDRAAAQKPDSDGLRAQFRTASTQETKSTVQDPDPVLENPNESVVSVSPQQVETLAAGAPGVSVLESTGRALGFGAQAQSRQSLQGAETSTTKAGAGDFRTAAAGSAQRGDATPVNWTGTLQTPLQQSQSVSDEIRETGPAALSDNEAKSGGKRAAEAPGPGLSPQENASAGTGTDSLKTADGLAQAETGSAAVLAAQAERRSESKDAGQESAIFQNAATNFHREGVTPTLTGNSAQSGSSYYDPYRSAELVQNAREQMESVAGRQLALELEPDGMGKISLRVGAKQDEISISAVTQNESARQALMNHSPELRQDLQDQGLTLQRFMVDVNGGKQGDGYQPQSGKSGAPQGIGNRHRSDPERRPIQYGYDNRISIEHICLIRSTARNFSGNKVSKRREPCPLHPLALFVAREYLAFLTPQDLTGIRLQARGSKPIGLDLI